jgi:hypothetical protein
MFRVKYELSLREHLALLKQEGFTPPQIKDFLGYRKLYCTGCYQFGYDSGENYRMLFARWLYQHGKIEG